MAREYLIAHGRAGHLGRFVTANGDTFQHGERVVIRSRRGIELGEILNEHRPERGGDLPDDYVGEICRAATADDLAQAIRQLDDAQQLCEFAESTARRLALPFTVLDVEVMLDGRGAVVHGLPHEHCDVGPLLEQLGDQYGLIVRLYDLGREEPTPAPATDHEESFKCDKPDCGEGDCSSCGTDGGCNTCSSGTSAKDLEELFSKLRAEMEQRLRVPLT